MAKKQYKKPTIKIEKFNLTQTVASGCGSIDSTSMGTPNSSSKEVCGWAMDRWTILWDTDYANMNCSDNIDVNDGVNGLCYNNPNGGTTIFNS